MTYLYENKFETIHEADVGEVLKILDPKSEFNNKLIYESGGTMNGYCYKDYNSFFHNPDAVCYIAESSFDEPLFVDYVNDNKERLIQLGGVSTRNSIKDEIKNELVHNEYYYEYQESGVVYTIEAKNFDDELINQLSEIVFDDVDWQSTSSYIAEKDWRENIANYYRGKFADKGAEI